MTSIRSTITAGTALAALFCAQAVWAHATGTISTISVPTPVAEGNAVDVIGKVVTAGQPAHPNQPHPAVDPDQPVTTGTMEIQICVDAGLAAPSAQCDALGATGTWQLCSTASSPCTPPASGTPNGNGEFTVSFDTSGLAGEVIGFRANYVSAPAAGTNHLPGSSSSEGADITVLGSHVLTVPVDIKPGSCPNPLNVNAKGVLPVAILGSATVSPDDIDPASVKLEGVTALRSEFEDVGEPFYPLTGKADALDCNELPPDGWSDLTVKFNLQDVVSALDAIEPLGDGQVRILMVTGKLLDGTDFVGEDVVQILKKK